MLSLRALGYRYPTGEAPAVGPVTAECPAGRRLLVTGPSGSGKTTLVRLLAGQLQRHGHGEVLGSVRIDGRDPALVPPAERVRLLGWVGQEPADQLVAGTVADELGFALASACWTPSAIAERVAEVASLVGVRDRLESDPRALSGGQQARVVVGAGVAGRAPVLVLDEPLAQLDPTSAEALLQRLDTLAGHGVTVVLVEHRLQAALPWADEVWLLREGALFGRRAAEDVDAAWLAEVGLPPPQGLALRSAWSAAGGAPDVLDRWGRPREAIRTVRAAPAMAVEQPVLTVPGIDLCRGDRRVLGALGLSIEAGSRVALLGANGTGKSTLLQALARDPRVSRVGRVLAVPQDPDLSLYGRTVLEELSEGARLRGDDGQAVADRLAHRLDLSEVLDHAPQALSRGQRLRLAVGAALSARPEVLLLDEPTSGQDGANVERVMRVLEEEDVTLVFATHDVGLALRSATRILALHDGRVDVDGPPDEVLGALAQVPGLVLPPVAALCAARGWPLLSLDDAVARGTS